MDSAAAKGFTATIHNTTAIIFSPIFMLKSSTRLFSTAALLMTLAMLCSGCLVAEKKEYRFTLNPDGSGSGTIKFVNIVSQDDEEKDVSFKDFAELVTDYLEGTKWEGENEHFTVTNKKLFEANGVLVGEVSFTFTDWNAAGFLLTNKCECCPALYHFEGMNNENYASSNGNFLGADGGGLPLIEFASGAKEFQIDTYYLENLDGTHPLTKHYKGWKK